MTVEPVVVRPEMLSKTASANDRSTSASWNGRAPTRDDASHKALVSMKAVRSCISANG